MASRQRHTVGLYAGVALVLWGLTAMFAGVILLLYIYAFASMIPSDLPRLAWWTELSRKIVTTPSLVGVLVGVFLIIGGSLAVGCAFRLAAGKPPMHRETLIVIAFVASMLFCVSAVVTVLT